MSEKRLFDVDEFFMDIWSQPNSLTTEEKKLIFTQKLEHEIRRSIKLFADEIMEPASIMETNMSQVRVRDIIKSALAKRGIK